MKARRIWLAPLLALALVGLVDLRAAKSIEAAGPMFGNGSDGSITFSSSAQFNPPVDAVVVSGSGSLLTVSSPSGLFLPGQRILIHQTRGTGAGAWELNSVQSYALGNLTTSAALAHTYASSGSDRSQVLVLPQYTNVTVNAGVTVTAKPWNGATGGILAFLANGTVTLTGDIRADGVNSSDASSGAGATLGAGFNGGSNVIEGQATQAEGTGGPEGTPSQAANGNGAGGGGYNGGNQIASGPGGGNGASGSQGYSYIPGIAAAPGVAAGTADLATVVLGGGGGGGSGQNGKMSFGGATGAGIVFFAGATVALTGVVTANGGSNGGAPTVCPNDVWALGGGGAGGSILIRAQNASFDSGSINATGGHGAGRCGDAGSGNGAVGRIRVEYCTSISGGFSAPPASVAQISCSPSVGGISIPEVLSAPGSPSRSLSAAPPRNAAPDVGGAIVALAAVAVAKWTWRKRRPQEVEIR